ncbi:hypothetical protein DSO57_1010803 [Entomophthora muscae]|uniref:Uncharacterized protein n=1 Tax=Entomophthora muscae TaxID=34485 RepID=A0ACC2RL36_9FUNG|nr:hypothetical protein DSO57_1010803 [Entomophthora muscae]
MIHTETYRESEVLDVSPAQYSKPHVFHKTPTEMNIIPWFSMIGTPSTSKSLPDMFMPWKHIKKIQQNHVYTQLRVKELALNHWTLGLDIVVLRINLKNMDLETQLHILGSLDTPKLRELALWSLVAEERALVIISSNFPNLVRYKAAYLPPSSPGLYAAPNAKSLKSLAVNYITKKPHPVYMTISSIPTNLTKVDLGFVSLDLPWHTNGAPIGPKVKELRLSTPHDTHLLIFHFPNIHTLDYDLQEENLDSYICVTRFKHLKTLLLTAAYNKYPSFPLIQSRTVTSLTLRHNKDLGRTLWFWIAEAFPNLVHLSIQGTTIPEANIPQHFHNAMPKLRSFESQTNLPHHFWDQFSSFAPNAQIICNSY